MKSSLSATAFGSVGAGLDAAQSTASTAVFPVTNIEPGELPAGRLPVAFLVPNVPDEPIADLAQQRVQLTRLAFGDQFHAAIGHIADETADFVSAGDGARGVAKANALHVARVADCEAL